jgi:hypothetical protein
MIFVKYIKKRVDIMEVNSMYGLLCVFIDDNKVYKVPKPKNNVFKAVSELSNKKVLFVELAYEIVNRRPYKLIRVSFSRVELDKLGQLDFEQLKRGPELMNLINYEFTTPKQLMERSGPLIIPLAPSNIYKEEKERLISYLKEYYPVLAKDCPLIMEQHIENKKNIYEKHIELIKKANKKKKI